MEAQLTKCSICRENVPWRSLGSHNKARHPVYRRAQWRLIGVSQLIGMFYLGWSILFVQNAYNNYSFALDLVYLILIAGPLSLAVYLFLLLRLTKLKSSLRAAAETTNKHNGQSDQTNYPSAIN
jgi:hypothetical protein